MTIGILGGTFNPIHNGHIYIALESFKRLALDEVHFVPSSNPPHKKIEEIVTYFQRIAMIELAIEKYPYFFCSELDFTGNNKSYTKNLIKKFQLTFPQAKLFFIIGADNIASLNTWHEYQWILENVNIVAVKRTGSEIYNIVDYLNKIIVLEFPPVDISSQDIRNKISNGESIDGLVPDKVALYIKQNNIYGNIIGK